MIKESDPEMTDATTDAARLKFEELVGYLSSLDYDRRRRELWYYQTSPRLPRFLYKFRSFDPSDDVSVDHIRDIVVKSRLWLSSPADFNDPFDMKASVVINGSAASLRARFHKILKQRGMRRSDRYKRVAEYMTRGIEHTLLTP